jgi:hypothetical protein
LNSPSVRPAVGTAHAENQNQRVPHMSLLFCIQLKFCMFCQEYSGYRELGTMMQLLVDTVATSYRGFSCQKEEYKNRNTELYNKNTVL